MAVPATNFRALHFRLLAVTEAAAAIDPGGATGSIPEVKEGRPS
jgi:hypothetical protein